MTTSWQILTPETILDRDAVCEWLSDLGFDPLRVYRVEFWRRKSGADRMKVWQFKVNAEGHCYWEYGMGLDTIATAWPITVRLASPPPHFRTTAD
jgi:hypothetical protein